MTTPDTADLDAATAAGERAFYEALNAGTTPDPLNMPEEQLLTEVTARCDQHRIRWVHVDNVHHSRRRGNGLIGFPDLLLVGNGGVAFRELKTTNASYRHPNGLHSAQTDWKYELLAAGQDWAVWTPADLLSGRVDAELARLAQPARTPTR